MTGVAIVPLLSVAGTWPGVEASGVIFGMEGSVVTAGSVVFDSFELLQAKRKEEPIAKANSVFFMGIFLGNTKVE